MSALAEQIMSEKTSGAILQVRAEDESEAREALSACFSGRQSTAHATLERIHTSTRIHVRC